MDIPERTNMQWVSDLKRGGPTRFDAIGDLRERLERGLYHYLRHYRPELADRPDNEIDQMAQDLANESIASILANLRSYRMESQFTTWAAKVAARVSVSRLSFYLGTSVALQHSDLSKRVSVPANLTLVPRA